MSPLVAPPQTTEVVCLGTVLTSDDISNNICVPILAVEGYDTDAQAWIVRVPISFNKDTSDKTKSVAIQKDITNLWCVVNLTEIKAALNVNPSL